MLKKSLGSLVSIVLLITLVSSCSSGPEPQSAADFYRENTVTLITPFSAGGGVDYAARLLASYWMDATGGTMVVKNVTGASGIVGANTVYAAEPDGLTIGNHECVSFLSPALFEDEAVEYQPEEFEYIGLIGREPYAFAISSALPDTSLEELQQMERVTLGGSGLLGKISQGSALMAELLNLKDARIVSGYKGASDIGLAMGRNEVDCVGVNVGTIQKYVDDGYADPPLFVIDRVRSSSLPDVPAFTELIDLSPREEKLFDTFMSLQTGKIFFAPPGTPEDRVNFLQDTFETLLNNDEFISDAKQRFIVWIEPLTGPEIAAEVDATMAILPEEKTALIELVEKYVR